jgi:transposase
LSVNNDWASFEALEAWARQTAARAQCSSLVFALESTGHYHKPLEEWLSRRGHAVRFVSTLATCRAKVLLDDSTTKTDEKDACVIADLARHGKSLPIAGQEERYAELRYLGEFRQRLTEEKTQVLNRLHRLLDLCFPELPGLFSELEGRAVRALLAKAPTPEEVVLLGIEELTSLLREASRGRLKRERAEQVLAAAKTSIGCRRGVNKLKLEVPYQLGRLDELERQLAEVERELVTTSEPIPYFRDLAAIPHLGAVTVAILLGELGDIRKYQHMDQLVKKAGLTLTERSSGKHKGKRRLSKRGRAQARQMLYLAATRMMKKDAPLQNYRLNHPSKPGTTLAVMGMKRILRMLFAVVHTNTAFNPTHFEVKLVKKSSEELAA